MQLTPQQQALLDGAQGETMAKVVKTLVMYGDTFGAQRMVPVTSEYGHTVISFGLAVMKQSKASRSKSAKASKLSVCNSPTY